MTFNTTPRRLAARSFKAVALVASMSALSLSAFAGDSALYGPVAPKGSSFVRVYNAANAEVSATVGSTNISDVAPWPAATSASCPVATTAPRSAARPCR